MTYAAQKANKGDNILVAQGQYVIESEQDLLYITIQIFPVLGRFNQLEQYQGQNSDTYLISISGVPAEYEGQLTQQGFQVVRDTKGLVKNLTKNLTKLSLQAKGLNVSQVQLMQQNKLIHHVLTPDQMVLLVITYLYWHIFHYLTSLKILLLQMTSRVM